MQDPTTTNGASSGGKDDVKTVVDVVNSECLDWLVTLAATGRLTLGLLDRLVHVGREDSFSDEFERALGPLDISDHIRAVMVQYVRAKAAPDADYGVIAGAVKTLVTDRSSPFCVTRTRGQKGAELGLPPLQAPTIRDAVDDDGPSLTRYRDRTAASKRALQVINQYKLWQFDSCVHPHQYLEWKFSILDVIDLAENDSYVQLEILLNCLSPHTSAEVRLNLSDQYSSMSSNPTKLMNVTLEYLDRCYKNLRSIRFVESTYLQCTMGQESLSVFLARFQRCARIYERARNTTLSDNDKIVSFGNALPPQYRTIATLVETMNDNMTFSNYAQRIMYLADTVSTKASLNVMGVAPSTADMNAVELNRKRLRVNEKGDAAQTRTGNRRPVGCICFRCGESGHMALNCRNTVKDLANRCSRCGSRKHMATSCSVALKNNCRRCSGAHFESICPTNPSVGHVQSNAISQFEELQKAMVAENAVMECDCSALGLVDPDPPTLSILIGSQARSGLVDSGAAANFIHPDIIIELFKAGSIAKSDVTKMLEPIRIRFGNGSVGESDSVLRASVKWNDLTRSVSFIIYPGLTPALILGRPFIKSFALFPSIMGPLSETVDMAQMDVDDKKSGSAWVHEHVTQEKKNLMIRFPLLESTVVEPIREQLRSISGTTEKLLLTRLRAMQKEGSVEECLLERLRVVVPAVLVDKRTGVKRTYPDADVHSRYRVTLDLRGFNRLKLYKNGDQFALIGSTLDEVERHPEARVSADQFQRSSFEILKRIPIESLGCFSKIDIANAYNSVSLPEGLQFVGTEVYDYENGKYVHFVFKTLMQGWKYSPCFFRMVAEYLVRKCREQFGSELKMVYIAYYQDDIILSASPEFREQVIKATEIVIRTLAEYSFQVRRDKVKTAVATLEFCGYRLENQTCYPNPSRQQFSKDLANKLWLELKSGFDKSDAAITKWVRSVTGIFQYCYGYLGPRQLESLRRLHGMVSKLADASTLSIADYEEPFFDLINFCCNGLPGMFLGSFGSSSKEVFSIIVTDANKDSWSGMLFKATVQTERPAEGPMPEVLKTLMEHLRQATGHENFRMYPVRIFGSKFNLTSTRQSSTYRERAAMLECVYQAYPLLEGPLLVVCDNKNCQQNWHDLECFGSLLSKLPIFQETVEKILWVPRDEIPSITDVLARMIATDDPVLVHMNAAEYSNDATPTDLKGEILLGYRHDALTSYLGVSIMDIYARKAVRAHSSDVRTDDQSDIVSKATKFFEIDDDGYLWFLCGSTMRLYIPNISSTFIQGGENGVRLALINRAHGMNGLHVGIHRTVCNVDKYWWPGMAKDIKAFVSGCWICISTKSRLIRTHQSTFQSSTSAGAQRPFQSWFVDHLGPLQVNCNTKYALVCVCAFSHFVHCVPVERVDAMTTALELFKLFSQFGLPSAVHSDQGTAFKNELDRQLSELLKYDRQFSPVYFPRCNGLAERAVGSIKSLLATMNATDLIVALPLICFLHNSMPTSRVSATALIDLCPFEAAFGFRPRTASEMDLAMLSTQPLTAEIQYFTRRVFRSALAESLAHTDHESVLASRVCGFQPGDLVVIIRKTALQPTRIDGPYVLLSRIGANVWRMFRLEEGLMLSVVETPESLLKKFEITPEVQGFPVAPPVPKRNPAVLKRNDFIIVRNRQSEVPSVSLHQVFANDNATSQVTSKLWSPNQLMEFYPTNKSFIVPYDDIVVSNFKLSNRLLSEPIQQVVFSLLGGGL